jgi:hypothetical protein
MADDEPANRSDSFACSYRLRSSARFFGQAGILVIRPQPVVSNFKIRPAGAAVQRRAAGIESQPATVLAIKRVAQTHYNSIAPACSARLTESTAELETTAELQ